MAWGDDSSVESLDDNADIAAEHDHVYAYPMQIGPHVIRTYSEFLQQHHDLFQDFSDLVSEYADVYWADFCSSLLDISDPEEMDAASRDMVLFLIDIDVSALDVNLLTDTVTANRPSEVIDAAAADELKTAVQDLTIDVFDRPMNDASLDVPTHQALGAARCSVSSNLPPMAPYVPSCRPISLCLIPRGITDLGLNLQEEWTDTIKTAVPDFPADSFDQYSDMETLATSRSNTRPKRYGPVVMRFEDGSQVNVGCHGFNLSEEISFPWMQPDYRFALSELFSAPGGEGLTCATPSMALHQMVSACMSYAVGDSSGAVVEQNNIDFLLSQKGTDYPFDVTSSSGLWDKSLIPPIDKPKWRTQSAISKYDIAKIIMASTDDTDVKDIFAKATANCLALEYPRFFRKIEGDVPQDLELQSNIYDQINTLPKNKISDLAKLSYESALQLGLEDMRTMDIRSQGKSWKEKRDTMISKLRSLRCRTKVAVPPLAIGQTRALPSDTFSIDVSGHHFQAGPYSIQGRSQGPKTHMDSPEDFRQAYPASGIVTEEESREICRIILGKPVGASGLTHKGPVSEFTGTGARFAEIADEIYSSSATAQLAEVRADIARAVDKNPVPQKGVWQQTYLYKGKICAWYLVRDRISSSDGYRVDWFAVTSYPVLGSKQIRTCDGQPLHLWPRQRFRSQETKLMRVGPRRLKLTLFSMLEKSRACSASPQEIWSAWDKLAVTLVTSTYASGKLYLTGRYLSSTMASPSSPFDEMSTKLVNPRNFADIFYLEVLYDSLRSWTVKTQYRSTCPLLLLPRSYAQLESYWMCWVPDEHAMTNQNFALCVVSLYDEATYIEETMERRCCDLQAQLELLSQHTVTQAELEESLKNTCALDSKGMLGWSWVGSLASGHALQLRSDAAKWERRFSHGSKSRTLVDHLTVRHSARLDKNSELQKGTVAEMMIDSGTDPFLSTISATYRFLFGERPVFFNHGKQGEHKEREISITDPDTRIALSDAELICGTYGVTTGVDYLKDSSKNKKFFDKAERVLTRGGGIQSSDASRYGPNMSNFAIAIMLVYLGVMSMHLRWASVVFARMAYRRMVITKEIMPELHKMSTHVETVHTAPKVIDWVENMPRIGSDKGTPLVWYSTSHHMGQGMSHHSSSLLHAGGICVCVDAVQRVAVTVSGTLMRFEVDVMVTSDDSTLLVAPIPNNEFDVATRAMRQIAARIFLQAMRVCRKTGLTMVSVKPNLVKEMISGVKGEFNSQDTGIGSSCPVLGFRELVTLIVHPSAPSLVGDYLNAHACAKTMALEGQGLVTGSYAHKILIDMIEERWGLTDPEKRQLHDCIVLPNNLTKGCCDNDLVSSPSSWLNPSVRACMYRMAVDANTNSEDLDPHVRDTVFSPLMHVKVAMPNQHKKAITKIRGLIKHLSDISMEHQAYMLDSSLRATLSSARSRNLGRIANRIRNRAVKPIEYNGTEFQRGTMIETTLNWIATVASKVLKARPEPSDVAMANKMAGFIKLSTFGVAAYPLPPRRRRSYPERTKKPRFRTGSYGSTPFGKHALERSGTVVVPEITSIEREAMQQYLALQRHRQFVEHVTYGGGYITSWASMSCAHIVALDISGDISPQMTEHVRIGDFSDGAVSMLRSLQDEHEGTPVLALHRHDGVRGLWHAVVEGSPITVHTVVDIDTLLDAGRTFFGHRTESGRLVVCALQGFDENPNFLSSEPLPDEVSDYQLGINSFLMPHAVQSVEDGLMRQSAVKSATYCTTVDLQGETCLFYIAPEIHNVPRHTGNYDHIQYRRGCVVASLATGGYWNSALRGVCFRSWMKGHVCNQTVWTGGTIGWRLSATSIPVYSAPNIKVNNVKDVIVGTGIDDPNQLSTLNPDFFSTGVKFVSQSNTETYSCAVAVGHEYRNLIVAANYGTRYHSNNGRSAFMDTMLPEISERPTMSRSDAASAIINLHLNGPAMDVW